MSLTGMLLYLVFTQERIDQCSSGVMILLSQDYLPCPTHVVLFFLFCLSYVASISGLSIFYCSFGVL
jgi:hypothetical protein